MFAIAKTSNGRFRPGADLLASQKSTDKKTATQNQLSTSLKSVDATSSTDPVQFLAWFFQTLNGDLKKQKVKLVESAFQGSLEMTQLSRPASTNPEQDGAAQQFDSVQKTIKFFMLSIDLPTMPLFKEQHTLASIPQVPLSSLFKKYDGKTYTEELVKDK